MGLFTAKSYVGLDIGHHTLRAAVIEKTPTGYRVAKVASAPTPPDTVKDGIVIDPAVLGLALKRLLKENHIHATTAAIAVSGASVVVRTARIPKMAESALRKSIKFEASRYVPSSVEESHIEFEILGDVDDGHMEVLVAAAPRDVVDSRVNACEYAGIDAEVVEVAAFATYRALVEADHNHNWSEGNIALVDFGGATTDVSIVCKGHFSVIRTIASGGGLLTQALQNYFKLPFEDAESGKRQLDFSTLLSNTPQENPPMRVIQPHLDDIVREIRRSVNYWQSQLSDSTSSKQIDALLLCGGASLQPGVAQYFEHKLGIKVELLGVYRNPRFVGTHTEGESGADIALVTGLGMVFKAKAQGKSAANSKKAKDIEVVEPVLTVEAVQPPAAEVAPPVVKKRRKKGEAIAEASPTVEPTLGSEPIAPTLNEDVPHLTVAQPAAQPGFGFFGKKASAEPVPAVPVELGNLVDEVIDAEVKATSKPKFSLFGKKATVPDSGVTDAGSAGLEPEAKATSKPKFGLFGRKPSETAAPEPTEAPLSGSEPTEVAKPKFSLFDKKPSTEPTIDSSQTPLQVEEIAPTAKPKLSMFGKKSPTDAPQEGSVIPAMEAAPVTAFSEPLKDAEPTVAAQLETAQAASILAPTSTSTGQDARGEGFTEGTHADVGSPVEPIIVPAKKGFNFFKAKAKEVNGLNSDPSAETSPTLPTSEEDAA